MLHRQQPGAPLVEIAREMGVADGSCGKWESLQAGEQVQARLGEMLECLCAAAEAQGLDAETALRGQTRKRVEHLRAEDEKTL